MKNQKLLMLEDFKVQSFVTKLSINEKKILKGGTNLKEKNLNILMIICLIVFSVQNIAAQNLEWSTYFGTGGDDRIMDLKIDKTGNVYVCGSFNHVGSGDKGDFPYATQDCGPSYVDTIFPYPTTTNYFIAKFNNSGKLLWATRYGEGFGGNYVGLYSLAIDSKNNVTVIGSGGRGPGTGPGNGYFYDDPNNPDDFISSNISPPANNDLAILKFDSCGKRIWATGIGSGFLSNHFGYDVAIDKNDNQYVVGSLDLPENMPLTNPGGGAYYQHTSNMFHAPFIAKFNSNNKLLWCTPFADTNRLVNWTYGGSFAVATDGTNNVFMAGLAEDPDSSSSSYFPLKNPGGGAYYKTKIQDDHLFFSKFGPANDLIWSTYFGGNTWEEVFDIQTDSQGNLYALGYTFSSDFPLKNPGGGAYFDDTRKVGKITTDLSADSALVFVLKFSNNGNLLWSTIFTSLPNNTNCFSEAWSLAIDKCDNVYITARTANSLPLKNPGNGSFFQSSITAKTAPFIAEFDKNGVLKWSTYYGDGETDKTLMTGRGIDIDQKGNVFMAGSSYGSENDPSGSGGTIPLMDLGNGAYYQATAKGNAEAFIAKFKSSVDFTNASTCVTSPIGFSPKGTFTTYNWNFGDPSTGASNTSASVNPSHLFSAVGTYSVTLVVTGGCGGADSVTKQVTIDTLYHVNLGSDIVQCLGVSVTIDAGNYGTPAPNYLWSNGATTQTINVSTAGTYSVQVSSTGCTGKDVLVLDYKTKPVVNLGTNVSVCSGSPYNLNAGNPGLNYSWNPTIWLSCPTCQTTTALPLATTNYAVVVSNGNCSATDTIKIGAMELPLVTLNGFEEMCLGSSAQISLWLAYPSSASNSGAAVASTFLWSPATGLSSSVSLGVNGTWSIVTASPTVTTTYSVVGIDTYGCKSDIYGATTTVQVDMVNVSPNVTITAGSSVTLTASASSGSVFTYNWSPSTGLNTNIGATVIASPTVNTVYTVTGTNLLGCTDSKTVMVSLGVVSGITKYESVSNTFMLYPNPTNGIVNLSCFLDKQSDAFIKIMSVNGQIIYSHNSKSVVGEYKHSIDMTGYAKGLYYIQIITAGETVTKKFAFD